MSNHTSAPSYAGRTSAQATDHAQPLSCTHAITAIAIGNGLEFYDFVVCSFFVTLIGRLYFPVGNAADQLLTSFAAFGTGFLMRPLGSLLIDMYADRAGRRPVVALTLWLMGLSSLIFIIALTYARIGVLVPMFVVLARLVQDFIIGGETDASTALLLEYADDRSHGFYMSWQPFSQGLTALFGTLVGLLLNNVLTPSALKSQGWRLVFVIDILVIPVSLIIRHRLEETTTSPSTCEVDATLPLLHKHRRTLVADILLIIGVASFMYIVMYYLSNYAMSVLYMPPPLGIWAACIATLVQVVLSPFTGQLADRVGRRKAILWSRVALLTMIYPTFALINADPSPTRLLIVVGCLSVPISMTSPASMMLVSEVLPRRLRVTGLSIAYYVAIAIFGELAQFFSTGLIDYTGNANVLAFYMIGCGLVPLIGLTMMPETLGRPLS